MTDRDPDRSLRFRPSRRELLASTGAGALGLLAGCGAVQSLLGARPADVTVFNDTGGARTVSVEVTHPPGESTVLSETRDVDAGYPAKFEGVFDEAGRFRFAVSTESGLSGTHEWDLPSTDRYLKVVLRDGAVRFEEKSR